MLWQRNIANGCVIVWDVQDRCYTWFAISTQNNLARFPHRSIFPFFSSPLSVVFSAFNFLFLCRGCYFFASGWLSIPFLAIFLFASCYFFSFYSFFLFNCPSHLCYRLICFNTVFGFSSYFFLVHLRENNCWKCFYFSVAVTGRQS